MSTTVIGRHVELKAILSLCECQQRESPVLVFEGEPGIGKTTLLRAGAELAERTGARVLRCVASSSETRLSYAALADLLAGVEQDVVESLPSPQRHAIRSVLLHAEPTQGEIDPRAVAVAMQSIVAALASSRVVIVIDDLQWLDRPTARAIAFLARRLPAKSAVIASRRLAPHDGTWLAQAAGSAVPESVEVLRLGPLDDGEVQQLLTARAPQLDRRARLQIEATSQEETPSAPSSSHGPRPWTVEVRGPCRCRRVSSRSWTRVSPGSAPTSSGRCWPSRFWRIRRCSCSSACSDQTCGVISAPLRTVTSSRSTVPGCGSFIRCSHTVSIPVQLARTGARCTDK